ncbi:MAG: ComEA family DNA-binding protein [Microbacterium sp.]
MDEVPGYRSPRARLGVGGVIVLVLAALAITIGVGIWRGMDTPVQQVQAGSPAPSGSIDTGEIYVHVSGAVQEPGLYVLSADARVVDAIAAAGGWADDAEQSGVNLARTVSDGEQLIVPRVGESPTTPADGAVGSLVNINTADEAALEELPGIGPALAGRIVAWREDNGPFGAVDDLLAVTGIGPKLLEGLRDAVTV